MIKRSTITEEWKPFPGFEGRYEVSNIGRVKSLPNKRRKSELILKTAVNQKYGHMYVNLTTTDETGGWRQVIVAVHRAVGVAFIPNPENKPMVLHGPAGVADNSVTNLYWGDALRNMQDRERDGTVNRGERNGFSKLSFEEVKEIKRRLLDGKDEPSIAAAFGCARSTIGNIAQGRSWRHVNL